MEAQATKTVAERDENDARERADSGRDHESRDVQPTHLQAAQGGTLVRNTITIAVRELRSYFDSLVAYAVIGLTMLAVGVYFFLMQNGGFWQVDRATMSRMFDALPWALVILVIPLVTMRALAEEKRSGTIELLITMPVRDSEVILGKYFAALGMVVILLAVSFLYPVAIFRFPWHMGPLDWGPIWAGYLGLVLFAAAGVAIGLLYSSLTDSQIIAFMLTALTLSFLQVIGLVVESVQGWMGDVIAFVSFQTRFVPFGRGLIDTRAMVYFVSVTVLCLLAAFRSLESRKWK